ncbi:MAG: VTT domain-containing protein [Candidatus Micrarchaeota archaeon]|nr:VTT domain-containing protein [Candidatus Micrarchaeota archaeon]
MRRTEKNIFRWELFALLLAIILIAFIYIANPMQFIMKRLHTLGYAGIFLLMFLSSASVLLPVPGLIGIPVAGMSLNPLNVGIVGGMGSALGELSGYFVGCGGRVAIEENRKGMYKNVKRWMSRNGFLTIFILAALPNPFFDVAGIAAGVLEYPVWKFLFACLAGNILKCVVLAYLGHSIVG